MKPQEWISWPVHHVLIAAYPILYLVSINLSEVEPVEALVPLAVSVGTALALYLVLVVVGVPARRAALLVSIMAVVILFFGLGSAAAASVGLTGTPMLVAWLLLGAGLVAAVVLSRTDLRGVTTVLNVGSAVLVAVTLVGIGGHLLSEPATSVGGQQTARRDLSVARSRVPRPEPGRATSTTSSSTPTARRVPMTSTWTCPTRASWTGWRAPDSRCSARRGRTTAGRRCRSPHR